MKEHPDYKYRPRRKPKPLLQQKKETKYTDCPVDNVTFPRNPFFPPHHSFSETDFKLSRALFPSLHYPFYQSKFHPSEAASNCKISTDFTLQALYGSSFYSQAAAAAVAATWPTIPTSHCGVSCINCTSSAEDVCRKTPSPDRLSDTTLKRPIACLVMKQRENTFSPPAASHVI